MTRRMLPLVLLTAAALASTAALASGPSLKPMVLHLSDLPAGFAVDYSHAVSKAQAIKKQGYVSPGFLDAWEAQWTREEGLNTAVIVSSVSRYGSAAQAHASMLDAFKRAAKLKKVKRISVGVPLGHESRAYSYEQQGATAYVVLWRFGNLRARVILGGLPSLGATAQQTTRLAVRQQARMKAAR